MTCATTGSINKSGSMRSLYEKSKWGFALLWIGAYIVLGAGADLLGRAFGTGFAGKAVLYCLMTAALLFFFRQNGLQKRFGLCRLAVPARRFLWFLPLAVICLGNLLPGVALPDTAFGTAAQTVCMLCVGILEELLFRGLLFRAMEQKGETAAIVGSSVLFGLMHLLNLFNGTPVLFVLCQVAFTTTLGFLFALILARGKSMIPCIAAHCVADVTSVFTDQEALTLHRAMLLCAAATVVALLYLLFLLKTLPKIEKTPDEPAS